LFIPFTPVQDVYSQESFKMIKPVFYRQLSCIAHVSKPMCFLVIYCYLYRLPCKNQRTTVVNILIWLLNYSFTCFVSHVYDKGLVAGFNARLVLSDDYVWLRIDWLYFSKLFYSLKIVYFCLTEAQIRNKLEAYSCLWFMVRKSDSRGAYGSAQRNTPRY